MHTERIAFRIDHSLASRRQSLHRAKADFAWLHAIAEATLLARQ
jgi:hypothetical protein